MASTICTSAMSRWRSFSASRGSGGACRVALGAGWEAVTLPGTDRTGIRFHFALTFVALLAVAATSGSVNTTEAELIVAVAGSLCAFLAQRHS